MKKYLRHRSADASLSGKKSVKSPSSFSKLPRIGKGRAVTKGNRLLQCVVLCLMGIMVLSYVVMISYVHESATDRTTHHQENTKKQEHQQKQKQQPNKRPSPKKRQADGNGDMLADHQQHVPKPLQELIPKLQNTKQKFQPVEKGNQNERHIFKAYSKKNQVQLEKKRDKKGNVVYNPITSIKKQDLEEMGFSKEKIAAVEHLTHEEAIKGKERLVDILNEAGITDVDPAAIAMLPKWSSVTKLYGDKPVILGLERCEEFRSQTDPIDASIGPAGMFNTGTNPLAMYISNNCQMKRNKKDKAGGTRWQVPWGKHMPASQRLTHTAGHDRRVNKTNVMPIVVVRDPYQWMQAMCRHKYEVRWPHREGSMCPNLAEGRNKDGTVRKVRVKVRYEEALFFDSLADYWAQWYKEYLEADYPRLIVRFEDIQYHARELVEAVCQCAGAEAREDDGLFRYVVDSAKWGAAHQSKSNMISAMVKYGTDEHRFDGMKNLDWEVAEEVFQPELMNLLGYEIPERLKRKQHEDKPSK